MKCKTCQQQVSQEYRCDCVRCSYCEEMIPDWDPRYEINGEYFCIICVDNWVDYDIYDCILCMDEGCSVCAGHEPELPGT